MTTSSRRLLLPLGAALAATLSGCPDGAPNTPANGANGNPPLTAPAGNAPLALTPLSQFDSAGTTSVAIAPNGTIHVAFTEPPKGGKRAVYHRASTDGGATWSAPRALTEQDRDVESARLAIDGTGRVYAFWKQAEDPTASLFDKFLPTLSYRVLEAGQWSAPVIVAPGKHVASWFVSATPTGQVHAVWSEAVRAPNGYQTTDPAVIRQAATLGATVSAPAEILAAPPANADLNADTSAWYYPEYRQLHGYVDAAGKAHFLAVKSPAEGDDVRIVHWDGTQETNMMAFGTYGTIKAYYAGPMLVRDAEGRDHALVHDVKSARQRLLDFTVGSTAPPAVVREVAEAGGELLTAQVVAGPQGRLAALTSVKDTLGGEHDLFVSQRGTDGWTPVANVTNNAQRRSHKDFNGATTSSSSYQPIQVAGAFDAQGRLNMAVVNMEFLTTHFNSVGRVDGELVNVTQGAAAGLPKAFFVKL